MQTKTAAEKAQATKEKRKRAREASRKEKEGQIATTARGKSFNVDSEKLLEVAQYLRDGKRVLDTYDGATYNRRVEYFKGDEFVEALADEKFTDQKIVVKEDGSDLTEEEAQSVGNSMLLTLKYFHRSKLVNPDKRSAEEIDKLVPLKGGFMEDDDEALYTWILPQSNKWIIVKSVMLVCFALFMTMIKAWPLWLKIAVWWVSLVLLIVLSSLVVVRIVFAAFFFLLGFRGLWLLPNVFYDEIDVLDAFTPLFGYGMYSAKGQRLAKEAEEAKKKVEEAAEQKAEEEKKAKNKDAAKTEGDKEEDDTEAEKQEEIERTAAQKKQQKKQEKRDEKHRQRDFEKKEKAAAAGWLKGTPLEGCHFGLINLAVVLIIGIIFSNYVGLFMPENIPDFVISQSDLYHHFPSLGAPPPPSNGTDAEVEVETNSGSSSYMREDDDEEYYEDDEADDEDVVDQDSRRPDDEDEEIENLED